MSVQRRLRARHQPLGATETGSVGFRTDTLRIGTPEILRSSRIGLLALSGLAASMMVLVVAAAGSNVLLPDSVRPIPSWLAGPFSGASIHIRSGCLVAVML